MALTVTKLDGADLPAILKALDDVSTGFSPAFRCAAHPTTRYPDREWLTGRVTAQPPTHTVYVASDAGGTAGLAVVHLIAGHIEWLCFNAGQSRHGYGETGAALVTAIKADRGTVFGMIENTALRDRLAAALPAEVKQDGNRLEWG